MPAIFRSPFSEDLIAKHLYQRDSQDCGPYSVAMILNSLLMTDHDPHELALEMNKVRWRFILPVFLRVKNWATFPWGISTMLREKGLQSKIHYFSNTNDLINDIGADKLQIVIVGGYRPLWAHYKILVEYDANEERYGFVDAGFDVRATTYQNSADFEAQWRNLGRIRIVASLQ